jgi:hypothetical protein
MSQLTQRDFDEIIAKAPEKRYKYFIREVMDSEEVYGLSDDEGWLLLGENDDNQDVIPFFPRFEFAEAFRMQTGLTDNKVDILDLAEFMEWCDDFEKDKLKIAVFLNSDYQGVVLEASRLKADIQKELDKEID